MPAVLFKETSTAVDWTRNSPSGEQGRRSHLRTKRVPPAKRDSMRYLDGKTQQVSPQLFAKIHFQFQPFRRRRHRGADEMARMLRGRQ